MKPIFLVKAYYDLCTLKNRGFQNVELIIYSQDITSGPLRALWLSIGPYVNPGHTASVEPDMQHTQKSEEDVQYWTPPTQGGSPATTSRTLRWETTTFSNFVTINICCKAVICEPQLQLVCKWITWLKAGMELVWEVVWDMGPFICKIGNIEHNIITM